jgi:hypothetical protein
VVVIGCIHVAAGSWFLGISQRQSQAMEELRATAPLSSALPRPEAYYDQ